MLTYILNCVCVAIVLAGIAMPAFAESLEEIYALARQNDPRYLAMRSEFEATAFAVLEARAGMLPSVALQAGRTDTSQTILRSDNSVFAKGHSSYPTNDRALSLTQPLFRLTAYRNWRQSQANERQAAAAFAAAEQDLMLRTATAYMAVLAAQDVLAFARGEADAIKRQLELAEAKFRSGQAIKVNLFDAQARSALKESDVISAENDLADKKQALRELTGGLVRSLQPLPRAIPLRQPEPLNVDAWVQGALDRNLLIEARLHAVEVARQEIDKRKAGYYPTLDLAISRNQRDAGGSLFGGGSSVSSSDIMLRLNMPLYEGGITSAQTAQAGKHHETALQDLERDRRQVERQTRAAYQGIVGGGVRVAALEQSVTALEGARMLKEEGYKSGITTILAVLDAERDLFAALRDRAQSRYDFQLNTLRLKQAAGTLNEEDLQRLSRIMN